MYITSERSGAPSSAEVTQPAAKRSHTHEDKSPQEDLKRRNKRSVLKCVVMNSGTNPKLEYISEYEKTIQKNIQERMEMLKMLQIDVMKEEVKASVLLPKKKAIKRAKQEPVSLVPTRRSARLCSRRPDTVPDRPVTPEPPPEPRKLGREAVAGTVTSCGADAASTVTFMNNMRSWLSTSDPCQNAPSDSYARSLCGTAVTADTWTKVTPQRITAMAFCPLRSQHVVAAGDKRGVLGLWDVSRADGGVHQMQAHGRHINGVSFSPADATKCYTTSYDGITRQLDMEKLRFDQVYATPDSEPDLYLTHHVHVGDWDLLIGRSDGLVMRADTRSPGASHYRLGDGCIRWLSLHPTRDYTLVTVQRPRLISLWDLRQLRRGGAVARAARPLQQVELPRACSSATISRHSGEALVSLCSDDTIRVFDGINQGNLTAATTIRHNTQTGRWLTTLKPTWLPDSDSQFVVGSMEQPRRMTLYHRFGPVYHCLMGPELQSVCSTVVCHPTDPAVAGGNSTGRVYLFK